MGYTGRCNNIYELFSSAGAPLILRSRLRDLVWRALKTSPDQIGNKALELGWRKIYYEPVHVARRLKKRGAWKPEDAAYIESHIVNGIGHYHSVITFLCDIHSMENDNQDSLDSALNSRESFQSSLVTNYGFDCDEVEAENSTSQSKASDLSINEFEKWRKDALHRCFT